MKYQHEGISLAKRELIWDIILEFYPDAIEHEKEIKKRVKVGTNFYWITIHSMVNSKMRIALGVSYDHKFSGIKSFDSFKEVENKPLWKAWQFVDGMPKIENNHRNISHIIEKHGLSAPTAEEMYEYYYRND